MKKEYIQPSASLISVQTSAIVCASNLEIGGMEENGTAGAKYSFGLLDEDEDDEEEGF